MGPRVIPALTRYKSGVPAAVAWCHYIIAHLHEWEYDETRPLSYSIRPIHRADCSWAVGWVAWRAGWYIDPLTGLTHYPDWGNSSSAWSHARHIGLAQVRPGDLIAYGPGGDKHLVFVLEGGRDPLCMSDGGPTGETPQYQRNSVLMGLGIPTYLRVNSAARHPVYPG